MNARGRWLLANCLWIVWGSIYLAVPTVAQARPKPAAPIVWQETSPGAGALADTFIAAATPTSAHAADPILSLGWQSSALFDLDLGQLPAGAQVTEAILTLWVEGRSAQATLTVAAHPLWRPWAAEANWLQAAAGALWQESGASGVADRGAPLSRQTLDAVGQWYAWDITAAVQAWQSRPVGPLQVILAVDAPAAAEYYITSSEWRVAAHRPRLSIRLRTAADDPPSAPAGGGTNDRAYPDLPPTPIATHPAEIAPTPKAASTLLPVIDAATPVAPVSPIAPTLPAATPTATAIPSATPTATSPWDEPPIYSEPLVLTPQPTIAPTRPAAIVPPTPSIASGRIYAKIEALWLIDARHLSATAYLFTDRALTVPPCAWEPTVRLWGASGVQPARMLAVGRKRLVEERGVRFPAWDFADVDLSAIQRPPAPLHFYVTVDGMVTVRNVVSVGADLRPQGAPDPYAAAPTIATQAPLDAVIQIVWPHGGAPVAQAERANVTAALFANGSRLATPGAAGWPTVRLHWSINDGLDETEGVGVIGSPREVNVNGARAVVWDFNDIDVRAARNPENRMTFWLSVDGAAASSSLWVHSIDGRPGLLLADLPGASCQ